MKSFPILRNLIEVLALALFVPALYAVFWTMNMFAPMAWSEGSKLFQGFLSWYLKNIQQHPLEVVMFGLLFLMVIFPQSLRRAQESLYESATPAREWLKRYQLQVFLFAMTGLVLFGCRQMWVAAPAGDVGSKVIIIALTAVMVVSSAMLAFPRLLASFKKSLRRYGER